MSVRWRGGEIERLLDEGHAILEAAISSLLGAAGWEARLEVTYVIGRERGSVDVLAYEPKTATLLVVEVKTELLSAESTARNHDQKVRLAPAIADQRFGWRASTVGALLVLPESTTARRRVEAHAELFRRIYPDRGLQVRDWLRGPRGALRAVVFLPVTKSLGARHATTARRRVSRCHSLSA